MRMRKSAAAIIRNIVVMNLNFMCGTWARCSSSAFRSAHLKKCPGMRCLLGKTIKKNLCRRKVGDEAT